MTPRRIVSNPCPGTPGTESTTPSAINNQPATFLPMTFKTRTVAFEPVTPFDCCFLKGSLGSLTRIAETMQRLMRKVPTKIRTAISTLRQVRPEKKSANHSNIIDAVHHATSESIREVLALSVPQRRPD